jgi:hypothetical protein
MHLLRWRRPSPCAPFYVLFPCVSLAFPALLRETALGLGSCHPTPGAHERLHLASPAAQDTPARHLSGRIRYAREPSSRYTTVCLAVVSTETSPSEQLCRISCVDGAAQCSRQIGGSREGGLTGLTGSAHIGMPRHHLLCRLEQESKFSAKLGSLS